MTCGTVFDTSYENTISACYSILAFVGQVQLLHMISTHKLHRRESQKAIASISLVLLFFILACYTLVVFINGQKIIVFLVMLFLISLGSWLSAWNQGSMCGLVGMMPNESMNMQIMSTGQALVALVVSIVHVISSAVNEDHTACSSSSVEPGSNELAPKAVECQDFFVDWGAFSYLLFSVLLCGTGMIFQWKYILGETHSFLDLLCIFYDELFSSNLLNGGDFEPIILQQMKDAVDDNSGTFRTQVQPYRRLSSGSSESYKEEDQDDDGGDNNNEVNVVNSSKHDSKDTYGNRDLHERVNFAMTLRDSGLELYSIFLSMTTTMICFTALLARMAAQNRCQPGASKWSGDLYVDILFFLYNVGDFLGRALTTPTFTKMVTLSSRKILPWSATIRVIFIPILMFTRVRGSRLPLLIPSDILVGLLSLFMGLSHGIILTSAFIGINTLCPVDTRFVINNIAVAILLAGLVVGSFLGYLILWIVTGSLH